ncbi:MAG: bifunctional diaminohydroxyphosphoribosylaminopyrimidine deaminase/5-amino-6-(5-phosphoribosylamino)uracil reductase RibD [Muribaculaceae bacterium]|nr:bifunctional diaminohydroxyphosphoribosylaminopyrimidine deaminase/5-amino-6-(5-phosphoribosylamino)uracil reductase RibD [Muribaculaceae bacterium]
MPSCDSVDSKNNIYMRRALQLARNGEGRVSPNPMVGAVIVADNRIIGEGFHAYYGGPHAEVNAIRSVKPQDLPLLKDSTIYVTLEPCAHHGKTPPCANLIVETGIPRVVVGAPDPNPLVAGKGVEILRKAGVEVEEGVLIDECREINKRFMKAQTSPLPHITLKWAQSSDGYMTAIDEDGHPLPVKFSSPLSSVWVHRGRANTDAILVGAGTEATDHPRLTTRLWGGNSPQKFVAGQEAKENLILWLNKLRERGITSLIVEGGPTLLESFISQGLYDEIRIETSPVSIGKGLSSPSLPKDLCLSDSFSCRGNNVVFYKPKDVKKA